MSWLHDTTVTILLGLSALLGVPPLPPAAPAWQVARAWEKVRAGRWVLEASSTSILDACRADPEARIEFPTVFHGAQRVTVDGRLVGRSGDPNFRRTQSFAGAPSVACADVDGARRLGWSAWSPSRYFARIPFFPRVTSWPAVDHTLEETLPLLVDNALSLVRFRRERLRAEFFFDLVGHLSRQ